MVFLKIIFLIANNVDPDQMQHSIWVFTVCQSAHFGVTHIQRVKLKIVFNFADLLHILRFEFLKILEIFRCHLCIAVTRVRLGKGYLCIDLLYTILYYLSDSIKSCEPGMELHQSKLH